MKNYHCQSRRAIQKHIKTGKLSATKGEKGRYEIDKSEFYRVFPDAFTCEQPAKSDTNLKTNNGEIKDNEIKYLKEQVCLLKEQLTAANERELKHDLREQKLLDMADSTTKLLTYTEQNKKKKRWFSR